MSTPNRARKSNRLFTIKFPYVQLSSYCEQALVSIETALLSGTPTELPEATVCVRTNDGSERWLSTKGALAICAVLREVRGYSFEYDGRNICLSIGSQVCKRWPTNKPAGKDNWSWLRPLAELLEVPQEDLERMFPKSPARTDGRGEASQADIDLVDLKTGEVTNGKKVVEASDDESVS